MPTSTLPHRTASALLDIGMAAPQVIHHRLTRMAISGPVLSPRDQQEFTRMVLEKQVAFCQAWLGMGTEMLKVQQQLCLAWMRNPWTWGQKLPAATDQVAAKTLAPIRQKAVANARRLSRTSLK